jgi:hypothetical protein
MVIAALSVTRIHRLRLCEDRDVGVRGVKGGEDGGELTLGAHDAADGAASSERERPEAVTSRSLRLVTANSSRASSPPT